MRRGLWEDKHEIDISVRPLDPPALHHSNGRLIGPQSVRTVWRVENFFFCQVSNPVLRARSQSKADVIVREGDGGKFLSLNLKCRKRETGEE